MLTLAHYHLLVSPLSGGRGIPSSWRVLGQNYPTGFRPHPRTTHHVPSQALTQHFRDLPQTLPCFYILPEALGHLHKSKPGTSSRYPILRLHFNKNSEKHFLQRGSYFCSSSPPFLVQRLCLGSSNDRKVSSEDEAELWFPKWRWSRGLSLPSGD